MATGFHAAGVPFRDVCPTPYPDLGVLGGLSWSPHSLPSNQTAHPHHPDQILPFLHPWAAPGHSSQGLMLRGAENPQKCPSVPTSAIGHCRAGATARPFLQGEVSAPGAGSRVGSRDCLGTDPTNAWGWLGTGGPCLPWGTCWGAWQGSLACLLCAKPAVRGCWGQGPDPLPLPPPAAHSPGSTAVPPHRGTGPQPTGGEQGTAVTFGSCRGRPTLGGDEGHCAESSAAC